TGVLRQLRQYVGEQPGAARRTAPRRDPQLPAPFARVGAEQDLPAQFGSGLRRRVLGRLDDIGQKGKWIRRQRGGEQSPAFQPLHARGRAATPTRPNASLGEIPPSADTSTQLHVPPLSCRERLVESIQ